MFSQYRLVIQIYWEKMFSLRLAFNLVTRPDYTCRTIVIFGTLQDWSLLVTSNSLALNNCFRYRPDGRYECLLSRKETKGLIISLCWYGSKDHHFTLLPGHILYRKPGGHKIVCTGVKFKSYFNVVKKPFQQIPLVITIQKKYRPFSHYGDLAGWQNSPTRTPNWKRG